MTALSILGDNLSPTLSVIGAALLHSLWQISLVGLAFALGCRVFKQPAMRHLLGIASLVAAIALPTGTFLIEQQRLETSAHASALLLATHSPESGQEPLGIDSGGFSDSTSVVPAGTVGTSLRVFAGLAWLLGSGWMLFRLFLGVGHLHRLRKLPLAKNIHEATQLIEARVNALGCSLGLNARQRKKIRVRVIQRQLGPCTFGLIRTTVLVPLSAITGLPAAQLDAVLLHELAHIRRHDAWFTTLQAGIDCFLFFHPVARWISSQTSFAREQACDDAVLEQTLNRTEYAESLFMLARLRQQHPATAAQGSDLQLRIRRILELEPTGAGRSTQLPSVAGPLAAITLIGVLAATIAPVEGARQSSPRPQGTEVQINAEVVSLSSAVLSDSSLGLSNGPNGRFKYSILTENRPQALQAHVLETLSAPTLITTVGSSADVHSLVEDPLNATAFRSEDGVLLNARLDFSIMPNRAFDDLIVADIRFSIRPAIGTIRHAYSERDLEVELEDFVLQASAPLLLLENLSPNEEYPPTGLLVRVVLPPTEGADEREPNDEPVTLTVRDGDLLEILERLTDFGEMNLFVLPSANAFLHEPVTITAIAVPVRQLLRTTLSLNCLEGTLRGSTYEVSPNPRCANDSLEGKLPREP